jgi:DNA-binding NarL/FixJ family response regulator
MTNKIRVLIADDQPISREGIQRILEREDDMAIVGVVQTAPEVLPQVRAKTPDVVLLDLMWYHDDQAMDHVIRQLRREYPEICIICLTVYDSLIHGARTAGAEWVTTKDMGKDELLRFIRAAYASTAQVVGPGELEKA